MNKEQFETLKERLTYAHRDMSDEASNYRAITYYPIFCVQSSDRVYGVDPNYSWKDLRTHYIYDSEDFDSIQEIYDLYGDADEVDEDDIDVAYSAIIWKDINSHFTRESAERYIEENRHNLNSPRIYVKSMNRCKEMTGLVDAIIDGKLVWTEN